MFPAPGFCPGPAPVASDMWGVNQQVGTRPIYLSPPPSFCLPQINEKKKFKKLHTEALQKVHKGMKFKDKFILI